jgi:hypothetical protein
MVTSTIKRLTTIGLVLILLSSAVFAQEQTVARNAALSSSTARNQAVASLLSSLPDADTLIYFNPHRIFSEAAPKVVAEAELSQLRQQFTELKQFIGIDPSQLDVLVMAVRFRKPTGELNFHSPEFLIVTSGDFSADTLLTNARLTLQDKIVDEKYGAKTLALLRIDELAQEAEKNPLLTPLTKLAVVDLNSNTIAVGSVSYLKAAIDAAEGRERIAPVTLNSLMRDPNALVSIAGSPWTSFAKSFGLMGTEAAGRAPRCDMKLGDFYAAVTMEGTNFRLRGAMNADNPDTAKIITGVLSGVMKAVGSETADAKSFPSMLKMISLTATDAEVVLQADFPQQMVADFLKEQMKPKVNVSATSSTASPKPATSPKTKRRRTMRKRT